MITDPDPATDLLISSVPIKMTKNKCCLAFIFLLITCRRYTVEIKYVYFKIFV
jgi:hypothetical protein